MAGKTSKKSAKVAKKAAAKAPHRAKSARRGPRKRVAAKAAKPRKTAPKSQFRKVAKPVLLAGGNPQIAKGDGDAPVQAGLHRGHARLETRRRAPRRAHRAHRPRRAQGREVELAPSVALRARAGSSTFIASRSTSRWLSSAARHCALSLLASPSTRTCATSTSTGTTSSTRSSWRAGFGRPSELPGWVP
jgi:hypothetical protein